MELSKLLLIVGNGGVTIFNSFFFRYEDLLGIRFVDTSNATNYAKFGNLVTNIFPKNWQKKIF